MKLRLIPCNFKYQPIDQIADMVIIKNIDEIGDILFYTVEDSKANTEISRKLAEVSMMTGKVFIPIPCDVKFFRLQEEE